MNIEKKRIEAWAVDSGTIGHISLDKLAKPETVKVTLLGEPIIPMSFSTLGHPNFSEEQANFFMFKEEELKRQNKGEYKPLEAEITYEERTFDIPRDSFDTIEGIRKSLDNLSSLHEMLRNRDIFSEIHKDKKLNDFVIFGCFHLDCYGQVWSIQKTENGNFNSELNKDVEDFESFRYWNRNNHISFTSNGYSIPTAGSVCPCCGKALTIDDVKINPCISRKGKFYHNSCWRNYRKLEEINKFTRCLMDIVYKSTDYTFDLLPNGYCHENCCSHIPWFKFHTIDGDIIMGWRKRVISIEWQENYKPFDFEKLFDSEDVTKWINDGKRGIHAWGKEKAYEYLKKVLATVNPNYSIY